MISSRAAQMDAGRMILNFNPSKIAIDDKTSPSIPKVQKSDYAAPDVYDFLSLSPEKGVKEPAHIGCFYNCIIYACGHSGLSSDPRVIHINCPGALPGEIRCSNMTLNPKYETVNYKCPDCSCDDDYIGEGKREQLKSKARNIIKTNYAKGWKGEEIQEILLKKGSMEPGLREVLLEDLIERNPKVIENVEKSRELADAFAKLKVSEELPTLMGFSPKISKEAIRASKNIKSGMESVAELDRAEARNTTSFNVSQYEGMTAAEIQEKHLVDRDAKFNSSGKSHSRGKIMLTSEKMRRPTKVNSKTIEEEKFKQEHIAKLRAEKKSWDVQEKLLNSCELAKSWMKEHKEKEAAAFLPRLKRMGETKPKGLEKSAPTSSEKAKVGEEDGEDGGWDILDEFEEAEWVEVPTPRSPRGFNQALRG